MWAAVFAMTWLKHDYVRPASPDEIQLLMKLIDEERPNIAQGRKLWRQLSEGWNLVASSAQLTHDLPPELESFVELANDAEEVLFSQHSDWQLIGPLQRDDYLYIAVTEPDFYQLFETHDRILVVGAMILVVTLLCLALVWSLTKPIRQLQHAVRRLSHGNFDLESLATVRNRNDVLGRLALDIQEMVTSLQRLLSSHQQLLRDVSHELRSPLTRLQIALAIARKKDTEQLLESEHGRIERAVSQVNNLISEILDLARLQGNDSNLLQKEKLPLKQQLQMWIEDAELEFAPKQLKIEWQLPSYVVPLNADWLLIERAFDNLLRNAIRFSPEQGKLTIAVRHDQQSKPNKVEISVQDEGPGVPEQELESIFNPFAQIDFARDHAAGGYGLGLALVKRIVELHGGSVGACNQQPGLRVSLLLPQE